MHRCFLAKQTLKIERFTTVAGHTVIEFDAAMMGRESRMQNGKPRSCVVYLSGVSRQSAQSADSLVPSILLGKTVK
jgi:hypothetical protein